MAEVLLDRDEKAEVDGLLKQTLDHLNENDQKDFLIFMRGISFAKALEKGKPDAEGRTA